MRPAFPYWQILLLAGALLLSSCDQNALRKFDEQRAVNEIKASLDNAVRNSSGEINRHALLYIDAPAVDFHFEGAAGIARVDTGQAMTPDRQFFIASVAKSMTAAIIYQLAEEGMFGEQGIDATLASLNVLPPEVMAELLRINGVSHAGSLTLRHLLTHTSGLRDLFFDGIDNPVSLMPGTAEGAAPGSLVGMAAFDEQFGLSQLAACTLEGIPEGCDPDDYLFRHKWIPWDYAAWQENPDDKMAGLLNFYLAGMNEHGLWEPGERFHYSDTNYILLGLVIEALTGNSLHHELRARLFDPLGMEDTYLVGATDPPADRYEKQLSEVWAWDVPAISACVDFSFDWGGGGVVSTQQDLHTFSEALTTGELFQSADTLQQMLQVPEDVKGISYASGLIVFPANHSQILYMMGSNGTWVEYYQPLDLVMIGSTDDFSNMPKQFMLHAEIYQILADHGLKTPMARMTSPAMLLMVLSLVCLLILSAGWLVLSLLQKRKKEVAAGLVKRTRWLTALALLMNLAMFLMIGITFSENFFQMLFGFSPEVRNLFLLTALIMAALALMILIFTVQLWRNKQGKLADRIIATAIAASMLIYAISIGSSGM